MPALSKRARQLRAARCSKKVKLSSEDLIHVPQDLLERLDDESEEGFWTVAQDPYAAEVHWEDYADTSDWESEEDCEFTEGEEEGDFDNDVFTKMMRQRNSEVFDRAHIRYQRVSKATKRTQQRHAKKRKELEKAANGYRRLTSQGLLSGTINNIQSSLASGSVLHDEFANRSVLFVREYHDAIDDLEKILGSKTLTGQNLIRNKAVLSYMNIQLSRKENETREGLALMIARCYNRGVYFARKLVSWEISWRENRTIEEGRKGCYSKTKSWFNDEGIQLIVRDCNGSYVFRLGDELG